MLWDPCLERPRDLAIIVLFTGGIIYWQYLAFDQLYLIAYRKLCKHILIEKYKITCTIQNSYTKVYA